MGGSVQPAEEQKAPLRAFLLYFLRLGTVGFGGPIAGTRLRRGVIFAFSIYVEFRRQRFQRGTLCKGRAG